MYKKFNNGAIFNNRNITIATENNYISEVYVFKSEADLQRFRDGFDPTKYRNVKAYIDAKGDLMNPSDVTDDVPNDYWFFLQPVKGYNQEIIANFNKEPLIKE